MSSLNSAIQLVGEDSDSKLVLFPEGVRLLKEKYGDKPCAFISGFGRFREGKSFLLNLLCQPTNDSENIQPTFNVKFGDKSITKGIIKIIVKSYF